MHLASGRRNTFHKFHVPCAILFYLKKLKDYFNVSAEIIWNLQNWIHRFTSGVARCIHRRTCRNGNVRSSSSILGWYSLFNFHTYVMIVRKLESVHSPSSKNFSRWKPGRSSSSRTSSPNERLMDRRVSLGQDVNTRIKSPAAAL